ncbi:hypothetical protein [Cetobacterium sp.]
MISFDLFSINTYSHLYSSTTNNNIKAININGGVFFIGISLILVLWLNKR